MLKLIVSSPSFSSHKTATPAKTSTALSALRFATRMPRSSAAISTVSSVGVLPSVESSQPTMPLHTAKASTSAADSTMSLSLLETESSIMLFFIFAGL
jgi:hypothetical protein